MRNRVRDVLIAAQGGDALERDAVLDEVMAGLFPSPSGPLKLGRYEVLERLGGGGQGVVHAAYDPALDRRVAIKILRVDSDRPEPRARLHREAMALARLAHPNVIAITDVGDYRNGIYIVMQYVPGQALSQWLQTPRDWRSALQTLIDAGQGLAAAHQASIVHRDFKPSNVWVGDDGVVRLLDFGLARLAQSQPESGCSDTSSISDSVTGVGQVMGTPHYMAPEQHAGAPIDARADQYSFCVTLFEALYGVRPFAGATVEALALAKRTGKPNEVADERGVPARLSRIVLRGLRPDPRSRWSSMAALLDALQASAGPARRSWVLMGGGVAGVVVLGSAWVASTTDERTCDRAGNMATVWSAARAASVSASLTRSGVPFAASAADGVQTRVDAWSDRWLAARAQTCRQLQLDADADRRMQCLDRVQLELDDALALIERADADVAERAIDLVRAVPDPESCQEAQPASPQADQTRRLLAQARALQIAGDLDAADAVAAKALTLAREQGNDTVVPDAQAVRGSIVADQGRLDEGLTLLQRAYLEATAGRRDDVAFEVAMELTSRFASTQDLEQSGLWEQRAVAALGRSGREDSVSVGRLSLARALRALSAGDNQSALVLAREATDRLAEVGDSRAIVAADTLARTLANHGEMDAAKAAAHRSTELALQMHGANHPTSASSAMLEATLLSAAGDPEASLPLYARAIEIYRANYGEQDLRLLEVRRHRAIARDRLGHREQAIEELRAVVQSLRSQVSADDMGLARALNSLSVPLRAVGRTEEAATAGREALRISQAELGEEHPRTAIHHNSLGEILQSSDPRAALVHFEAALDATQKTLGQQHYLYGVFSISAGQAQHALGNLDAALRLLRRGAAVIEASPDTVEPQTLAEARREIARVQAAMADRSVRSGAPQ